MLFILIPTKINYPLRLGLNHINMWERFNQHNWESYFLFSPLDWMEKEIEIKIQEEGQCFVFFEGERQQEGEARSQELMKKHGKKNFEQEGRVQQLRITTAMKYKIEFVNEVIKTYSIKYFINIPEEKVRSLSLSIIQINTQVSKGRNVMQTASAAIYYLYPSFIRMSTLRFCLLNRLILKQFNRFYIIFSRNHFLQDKEGFNDVKEQDVKQEDGDCVKPIQAFGLIYDRLFTNNIMQDHRHEIITKIAKKYEETSQEILNSMNWTNKKLAKFYYLVHYYIKSCGGHMPFKQLRAQVMQKTNINLSKVYSFETLKLFRQRQRRAQELKNQNEAEKKAQTVVMEQYIDKFEE